MNMPAALERTLKLLDAPPAGPDISDGYLNLLGPAHAAVPSPAQRVMQSAFLPRIYEKVWRPAGFNLAKGWPFGPDTAAEYALARERLGLAETGAAAKPGATVLDVACGPGNVTRALAAGTADHGLVVGIDLSATMLARAVADTYHSDPLTGARPRPPAAQVAYVRGSAVDLPFREGSFDAVCCFGALYLFDDPWTAIDGMTGVLKPGGAAVVLTLRRPPATRLAAAAVEQLTGVRLFGPGEVTEALSARGFVEIRQRSYALMQFVSARLS
jgi:ubiquinone/menaquinone biosynthesis C-methylase UbiE